MWIYSKRRGEHDLRYLMNLDQCSRINLTQIGERWFIEVMLGSETVPIAQVNSQEEADAILREIFESLAEGKSALDLDSPEIAPEQKQEEKQDEKPEPQHEPLPPPQQPNR